VRRTSSFSVLVVKAIATKGFGNRESDFVYHRSSKTEISSETQISFVFRGVSRLLGCCDFEAFASELQGIPLELG
jgi:hypothetical protein